MTTLRVERVTVMDPEGREKARDVPALIREHLPLRDHLGQLADAILDKHVKAAAYAPHLSHINLIVIERSDRSLGPTAEVRVSEVLTPELKSALWDPPFREVFVTMIEEHRASSCLFVSC